jgi:hypothetical protein
MNSLARVALLCTQLNYLSIVLARPTWFVPWVPLGKGPFTLATRSDPQSPKPVTTAAGAARDAATQGDAANQPRQQQLQQPLELTPQYNAFPWIFTTQRLYIIPMVPPAQAPTPAPAHADYTESLNGFIGLQSTIALITYSGESVRLLFGLSCMSLHCTSPSCWLQLTTFKRLFGCQPMPKHAALIQCS